MDTRHKVHSNGLVQFVLMLNVNRSLAKARPTMPCIPHYTEALCNETR